MLHVLLLQSFEVVGELAFFLAITRVAQLEQRLGVGLEIIAQHVHRKQVTRWCVLHQVLDKNIQRGFLRQIERVGAVYQQHPLSECAFGRTQSDRVESGLALGRPYIDRA